MTLSSLLDHDLPNTVLARLREAVTIPGTRNDDDLAGTAAGDVMAGGEGDDRLRGFWGDDVLYGGELSDFRLGMDRGNDRLFGFAGDDILIDTFEGTRFEGGDGDDFYILLSHGGDGTIVEQAGPAGGTDTVYIFGYSDVVSDPDDSFTLPDNVENLVLGRVGTEIGFRFLGFARVAHGNDLDNRIVGQGFETDGYWFEPIGYRLEGRGGNDTLIGHDLGDILDGGAGNDRLEGGGGDDILLGGGGVDSYDGGDGNDTVRYPEVSVDMVIDLGRGTASFPTRNWPTERMASVESAEAGSGNDLLIGDGGANRLWGGGGNDVIRGRGGDDVLHGGDGTDRLIGGGGSDTAHYAGTRSGVRVDLKKGIASFPDTTWRSERLLSIENAAGGDHADTLRGDRGANTLRGAGGDDAIKGLGGADILAGDDGDDRLSGGGGSDRLEGGAGDDRLFGGSGDDHLDGGDGANVVKGGAGADTLVGGRGVNLPPEDAAFGSPEWHAADGSDILAGGSGDDTYVIAFVGTGFFDRDLPGVYYEFDGVGDFTLKIREEAGDGRDHVRASIDWTLSENVENLTLTAMTFVVQYDWRDPYQSVEAADFARDGTGNGLDNALTGNSLGNRLSGLDGDDVLAGGAGGDTLVGGAGNDRFVFGARDFEPIYYGGGIGYSGPIEDRIEAQVAGAGFRAAAAFEGAGAGGGDLIDLREVDALAATDADDAFVWTGLTPGGIGTLWAANDGADTVITGLTGGDDVLIRIADAGIDASAYTADDFLL